MLRPTTLLALISLGVMWLAACQPARGADPPTPGGTATPMLASAGDPAMPVDRVQVEVGVGSPIPVEVLVDGNFPDTCAQIGAIKQQTENFTIRIELTALSRSAGECGPDPLPFRLRIPLNALALSQGTYTLDVNGMHTTFEWPAAPTITPEPATVQTYRNTTLGFEVDYPGGWLLESAGDDAILWSQRPAQVGMGGVPGDVAKIDISTEFGSKLTLDELLACQKKGVAEVNGRILSEEEWTLSGGLRAVRMRVSAVGDNVTLLTIIGGQPVVITGFGDTSRFDEIAHTLRAVQP